MIDREQQSHDFGWHFAEGGFHGIRLGHAVLHIAQNQLTHYVTHMCHRAITQMIVTFRFDHHSRGQIVAAVQKSLRNAVEFLGTRLEATDRAVCHVGDPCFTVSTADKGMCPLVSTARLGTAVNDTDRARQSGGNGLRCQTIHVSRQLGVIDTSLMDGSNPAVVAACESLLRAEHFE